MVGGVKGAISECVIMESWSSDLHDEEAPEEFDAPSPPSFDIPLSYMNKTIVKATLDFHQMIETIVSTEIRESTDVVNLLKGKYLPVFVPHNWTGITGISNSHRDDWRPSPFQEATCQTNKF